MKKGSVSNWDPGAGKADDLGKKSKLFSTTASDAKDTVNGTNELKEFRGKSGKPSGPFGTKGHEF